MDYTTANKILAQINLRRDWTIIWHRINETNVLVEIQGIVDDSGDFPLYEGKKIHNTQFNLNLAKIHDAMDLLNAVMVELIRASTHEEREFFRVGATWTAPFHPHTPLGNSNWENVRGVRARVLSKF